MAPEEKQGKEFDPESCFVEWRGTPDRHRSGDTVMTPEQAAAFKGVLPTLYKMRLSAAQAAGKKMSKAGVDMNFSAMSGDGKPLTSIGVVSGDGPKFVVREGTDEIPAAIGELRRQMGFPHERIVERNRQRVESIGTAITEELDNEAVLAKVADVRDSHREIARIPAAKLSGFKPDHQGRDRFGFPDQLRKFVSDWLDSKMPKDNRKVSAWISIEGEDVVISAMRYWH